MGMRITIDDFVDVDCKELKRAYRKLKKINITVMFCDEALLEFKRDHPVKYLFHIYLPKLKIKKRRS